jgi:hypothetical protein
MPSTTLGSSTTWGRTWDGVRDIRRGESGRDVARIFGWGILAARVRCASARRSSCGMGPVAQPPENFEVFVHYIPPRSNLAIENSF